MNRSSFRRFKQYIWILVFSLGPFSMLPAQNDGEAKGEETGQVGVPADVVVERYDLEIDVFGPEKVTAHYKILYRVNQPEGVPYVQFSRITDRYRSLTKLEYKLLGPGGGVARVMGRKDLINRSYASDYSLMEDNRLVFLPTVEPDVFPYYVALDYEMEYNSAFFLPSFHPVFTYGMALKEGVLRIQDHGDEATKFKVRNYEAGKITEVSPKVFELRLENIEAVRKEEMAPPIFQLVPWVEVVPGSFKMDRTSGGFATWEEFGGWIAGLGDQKNDLSEATVREVQELVAGLSSDREKAARIYRYLQDNTRYVSIQLGIGGYRPFSAGKVDQWGYGDCKALSNYMVTMLKEVGIEAYYTLVYSGRDNQRTSPDFPANNFNHVIACLPIDGDTIWMECTSQTLPFNYLGASTSDRYALMIKGEGAKLVRTPQATSAGSVQDTRVQLQVGEDGTLDINMERKTSGEFLSLYSYLAEASSGDTEKWMRRKFGKTSTTFSEVEFSRDGQQGQLSFQMVQPDAARKTGKYLFVPRIFENEPQGIDPVEDPETRKLPIYLNRPKTLSYTWDIEVPSGYEASRIPKDILIENEFGKLVQTSVLKEGHLQAEVELVLNEGTFPPEKAGDYNELAHGWKKSTTSKWVFALME